MILFNVMQEICCKTELREAAWFWDVTM